MHDIKNLNKFRQKSLELIFQISKIDSHCQSMLTKLDDEDLQKLGKLVQEFNSSAEMMQNSLELFIKDITDFQDDDDEIVGEETDDGYVL